MLRINTFIDKTGKQHAYFRFIKDFNSFTKYRELMRVLGPRYMKTISIEELFHPVDEKDEHRKKDYFFTHQTNFCVGQGLQNSEGKIEMASKNEYSLMSVHIDTAPIVDLTKLTESYTHPHIPQELIDGVKKLGVTFIIITQIDVCFFPVNTAGLLLALGVPREKAMEYMKETNFNVTNKLLFFLGEIPDEDTRERGTNAIAAIIEDTANKIKHLTTFKWSSAGEMTLDILKPDIEL